MEFLRKYWTFEMQLVKVLNKNHFFNIMHCITYIIPNVYHLFTSRPNHYYKTLTVIIILRTKTRKTYQFHFATFATFEDSRQENAFRYFFRTYL